MIVNTPFSNFGRVDLGMAVSMTFSIRRTCVATGSWSSNSIRVLRGHHGIRGRPKSYCSASKNLAPTSQPINSSLLNIQPMSSRLFIQPMNNSVVRASSQLASWMGQGLSMGLHGGHRQDNRKGVVIILYLIFLFYVCIQQKLYYCFTRFWIIHNIWSDFVLEG